MHETVRIRLADLLLDQQNARLEEEQGSQPATYLALARLNAKYLLELATDIVDHGMDPLTLTAVIATGDRRKGYTVLEGNRRVLALKALETPAIVAPALTAKQQARLNELSSRFHANPIGEVDCVLFDDEPSARHWIYLRHTGLNDGAGVLQWDSDNVDAYKARHGGQRSPAGQVIDLLKRAGLDISSHRISTNIARLLSTPEVREALGLRLEKRRLLSEYPAAEVLKGLAYIAEELRAERLTVANIYNADLRREFAAELPRSVRPKKGTRLPQPIGLDDLDVDGQLPGPPASPPKPKPRPRRPPAEHTSIVPPDCPISPEHPRLSEVFAELSTLNAGVYPNACSVLLRVFVELLVDHYIERENVIDDQHRRNASLAKKLKETADHLLTSGDIPKQLRNAVHNVADGNGHLKPSVTGMHVYVHNLYAYPKATELRAAWKELQPFLEKL